MKFSICLFAAVSLGLLDKQRQLVSAALPKLHSLRGLRNSDTTSSTSTSSTSVSDTTSSSSTTASTTMLSTSSVDCLSASSPPNIQCSDWNTGLFLTDSPPTSTCGTTTYLGVQCGWEKERLHWKCGQDGDVMGSHEYKKGKIEVNFSEKVKGVEISFGGSVEYEEGHTTERTFKAGDGCGECTAWWKHAQVCNKIWKYYVEIPIDGNGGGTECVELQKKLKCTDSYGPSASTCSRTNCP